MYKSILQNSIFYLDYWSIVHFSSGAFLLLLFLVIRLKYSWLYLSLILFTYEIIEVLFKYYNLHIFAPETFKDQFTDIIVGYLGALFLMFVVRNGILNKNRTRKLHEDHILTSLVSSGTIVFIWIGFFNTQYNKFYAPDAEAFNWLVFIIWVIVLIIIVQLFVSLTKILKNKFHSFLLTWCLYLLIFLFIFELPILFFNYNPVNVISQKLGIFLFFNPSTVNNIFYLILPAVAIVTYELLLKIRNTAIKNEIEKRNIYQ
ncbi:MAG: hypothetical protein NTX22_17800 [Ignavibacteriales bacterium]|nr:hypothetical protein [Ignavibacteriales bacterium]